MARSYDAAMKLGLHVSDFTWPGGPPELASKLSEIAQLAEDVGFDRLSVMDHVWQIHVIGPPEHEMLEAYTALGYLAARTRRLSLMTVVTGSTYRSPGMLAKMVTTLDVLSGGRAWLGIGAAWNEDEARGLDLFFPPLAERFERLEEILQICLQMWSDDDGPYNGRYYQSGQDSQQPAKPVPASSAHIDRRFGREEDASPGGQIRSVLQHIRRPRLCPQARRIAGSLRGGGPQLRRDRKDRPVQL